MVLSDSTATKQPQAFLSMSGLFWAYPGNLLCILWVLSSLLYCWMPPFDELFSFWFSKRSDIIPIFPGGRQSARIVESHAEVLEYIKCLVPCVLIEISEHSIIVMISSWGTSVSVDVMSFLRHSLLNPHCPWRLMEIIMRHPWPLESVLTTGKTQYSGENH